MATKIKLLRGTTLNPTYTIGTFTGPAEPWFISGTGLNQLYVDGIPINPHLKVGAGLTIAETLGTSGALESYNTLSFDLSTYSATTMGNALELITTGTAGEIGLFAGYDLFVGGVSDTSSATSLADDAVYIHMRSKNGNNHDKIKIVSGTGATVTAANDVITVSATGVGVTLYDFLWTNYSGTASSLYDPETTGYTFNAIGGLKFVSNGIITSLDDTKTFIVGNSVSDTTNETFSGNAKINFVGDGDSIGTKFVYSSFGISAGTGISLSSTGGVITVSSTITDTDTHYTSTNIVAATKTATTEATVSANGVYLNHLEQTALSSSTYILGTNGIKVFSDVAGKINIRGTRIVVSNSATGITDGTSFSGPVYINLVGDSDGDDTLEVLDSVKLVGSGAASLEVGSTAKEITIKSTDSNTTYTLETAVSTIIDETTNNALTVLIGSGNSYSISSNGEVGGAGGSVIQFTEPAPNSVIMHITIIDGGTF